MRPRFFLSTGVLCVAHVFAADLPVSQSSDAAVGSSDTAVSAAPLRRIDLETHTPVRVITRQELSRFRHLGLGEALQRLPFMLGSAPNLNSNAAGDGTTQVDIGGLGRARCIVMLNGRRLPVNELLGEPAVDLEALPLAAIDRVEIFLGGASPLWGADAVSGVVNVITREETDGLELNLAGARSAHGDGNTHRAAAFAGKVFGRGYANIALEYRDSDPILSSARAFSARSEALGCLEGPECLWPYGSTTTPGGAFVIPEVNELNLPSGRFTRDASGDYRPFAASGSQNDLYSTQTDAFLRAGRSGGSLSANGSYEISPAAQLRLDLIAATHRTHRQLAALPLTTIPPGGPLLGDGEPIPPAVVPPDSFYNPFQVQMFDVRRRLVELGPRSLIDDTDSLLLSGSLRSTARSWNLEGALSLGWLNAAEHVSHVVRHDRLILAVGSSGPDINGVIRCGTPEKEGIVANPLPGCVPLDLFSGPGSISPEMLEYVTGPQDDELSTKQTQASVIARRPLPLGSLRNAPQIALGAELRRLNSRFDFGGFDQRATSGSSEVEQHDLFTELAWPLRGGSLISVGGRFSSFENRSRLGSGFAAALWRLNPRWLVRGRVTQLHRAPSAGELFLGPRTRILPVNQPCLAPAVRDGAICEEPGMAAGEELVLTEDTVYMSGGNPDLRPERGYGASAGFAWDGSNGDERYIGLDLTWLSLDDTIRTPGAREIADACQKDPQQAEACDRLTKTFQNRVLTIDGTLLNSGRNESARLDLEARSSRNTRWGNWRADVLASYLLRREMTDIADNRIVLRGTFNARHSNAGIAYPTLRSQARLQWSRSPWTAEWRAQHIGSYDETLDRNGFLSAVDGTVRRVGSVIYHDIAVTWAERSSPWSLQLNIDNLFDRAPPRVNNGIEANTDSVTYRLEGRLYSLGLTFSN